MSFNKKLPEWNNPGTEPPQSTKDSGWTAGAKPPADWFNWFFNLVYQALKELQDNGYTQNEITQAIANAIATAVPKTDVTTIAAANKLLKLDANGKFPASITGGADGNAGTASKLQTARTIGLGGDASGSVPFDGSGNITITVALAAASILSKLLTVDGSGSGLDGDTVDGNHYSDIITAINNAIAKLTKASVGLGNVDNSSDTNKPVSIAQAAADTAAKQAAIDWAKSFGLGTNLTTRLPKNQDLNAVIIGGTYDVEAPVNGPFGQGNQEFIKLIVVPTQDLTFRHQIALSMVNAVGKNRFFLRECQAGVYSSWREIAGKDDVDAATNWVKSLGIGSTAKQLPSNTNLNNLSAITAIYGVNAAVNAPPRVPGDNPGIYHYIINIAWDVTPVWVLQVAIEITTGTMFTRTKIDPVGWTIWKQLAGIDDINALKAITQNVKVTADSGEYYLHVSADDDAYAKLASLSPGFHTVFITQGATNYPPLGGNFKGVAIVEDGNHYLYVFGMTDQGRFLFNSNNNGWGSWMEPWNSSNDGSGSGSDADMIDGKHINSILADQGWLDTSNTTDLDTLVNYASFTVDNNAMNKNGFPTGAYPYGQLLVFGGSCVTQMYIPDDGSNCVYKRTKYFNSVWRAWKSIGSNATVSDITYYVDFVNGNDNNGGRSIDAPLKTLQEAFNRVPDIVKHTVHIELIGVGDFNIGITTIEGRTGNGEVHVLNHDNNNTPSLHGTIFYNGMGSVKGHFDLTKLQIDPNNNVVGAESPSAFLIENSQSVQMSLCDIDGYGRAGDGVQAVSSYVLVDGCSIHNCQSAEYSQWGANILSQNCSGENNARGLLARNGGTITKVAGGQPWGDENEAQWAGGHIL